MDGVVGRLQLSGCKRARLGKDLVAQRKKACTSGSVGTGVLGIATTFLVGTRLSKVPKGEDKGRVGNETSLVACSRAGPCLPRPWGDFIEWWRRVAHGTLRLCSSAYGQLDRRPRQPAGRGRHHPLLFPAGTDRPPRRLPNR